MGHHWDPARFAIGTLGRYRIPDAKFAYGDVPFTLHPFVLIELHHTDVKEEVEVSLLNKGMWIEPSQRVTVTQIRSSIRCSCGWSIQSVWRTSPSESSIYPCWCLTSFFQYPNSR